MSDSESHSSSSAEQEEEEEEEELDVSSGSDDEQQPSSSKPPPPSSSSSSSTKPPRAYPPPTKQTEADKKREALLIRRLRKAVTQQAKLAKKHETQKLCKEIALCKERKLEGGPRMERAERRSAALKLVQVDAIVAHVMMKEEKKDDAACVWLDKLVQFKGLLKAVKELEERPLRERQRADRERHRRRQQEKDDLKRAKRLEYEIQCTMCTARFATEETRQLHMEKRHGTTGNAVLDKKLGLQPKRANRAGQRERRMVAQELEKEEDGEEEEKQPQKRPPREELHPSWAAKRSKPAASAGFEGKAQAFDDE